MAARRAEPRTPNREHGAGEQCGHQPRARRRQGHTQRRQQRRDHNRDVVSAPGQSGRPGRHVPRQQCREPRVLRRQPLLDLTQGLSFPRAQHLGLLARCAQPVEWGTGETAHRPADDRHTILRNTINNDRSRESGSSHRRAQRRPCLLSRRDYAELRAGQRSTNGRPSWERAPYLFSPPGVDPAAASFAAGPEEFRHT
ncbi:MAG: hypothetical protein QOI50_1694 [Pseudonocardiales bacterium]|nr:hypothetical protein [Pseudonocardiales bacterium]